VPSNYPDPYASEPEPEDDDVPQFGPRAVLVSAGSLVVGWLVLMGLEVSGDISNKVFTIGCVAVFGVVAYTAYMWGTREARRAVAARVAKATRYRHFGGGSHPL
jgi:uncharacterized membrane protein YebE (DUF533 family)